MEELRAFGCTKEEFIKLYNESHGFNADIYKNCQISEDSFDEFIIEGSKGLSKNSNISKFL